MTDQSPELISRARFTSDIGTAIAAKAGWAGGKTGYSEQHWLHYPVFLAGTSDERQVRAYEIAMRHHFERQAGVFPSDPQFAREFVARYAEDVRDLDCLGLTGSAIEPAIIRHHALKCSFVRFVDMEPERSTPCDDSRCYLQHFRGARLLLVAPFADFLCQRANREIYERVWSRIGKQWFHPASVAALEFPYGYEKATWDRFGTVLNLRDHIRARIDEVDFDVALIAAGALGIPLAAHIKRSGRLALSLGGHLQIVFGVLGERWRNRESWRRSYFNESWVDVPEHYRPTGWQELTDGGAYW